MSIAAASSLTVPFKRRLKIRVLAGQHYAARQQVIRIDYENTVEIGDSLRESLRQKLVAAAEQADAIIISDYNYGVADGEIVDAPGRSRNAAIFP